MNIKKQHSYKLFIYIRKITMYFLFISTTCNYGQYKTPPSSETETPEIRFDWNKRRSPKALKPYFEALKNSDYGVQRFSIYEQLITHHIHKNNTDSILHYSNLYLKDVGSWKNTMLVKQLHFAKIHYYLGVGNFMNGLIDNAIKWHIKGLQDAEKTKLTEYQYKNKIGLSKCYIEQGKTDKAIKILQDAITEFAPEFASIKTKNNLLLGKAYRLQKKYNKANTFYQKAMKIADSLNDIEMQFVTRLEQAKLAQEKEDVITALQGYETTRNDAKENGYDAIYYEGSLLIAKLYYHQKQYDVALIGLSTAYINAMDSENLQFQKELLELQSTIFLKKQDYKNAYAVMSQLSRVAKNINTKQQREIIKELEIEYETLEKEKEISSLEENQIEKEAELKRQKTIKNAFLIGFLVILIPVIGLLYVYYQKIQTQSQLAKKQEEINTQKVTALKQEQELNLIKASIAGQDEERKRIAQELHDSIGGNLAGIKLQISSINNAENRIKDIVQQLDDTYQLVRDISHTLVPKKYRQHNFIGLIEEYSSNISKTGKIEIVFTPYNTQVLNAVDDTIQMELFKIIQELMTNTLKHAQAKKIDIQINYIENEISLMFEDNGIGFETTTVSEGIGFKNIKNRVSQLTGNIHIDSLKNRGTIISIEIPTTKNNHYEA